MAPPIFPAHLPHWLTTIDSFLFTICGTIIVGVAALSTVVSTESLVTLASPSEIFDRPINADVLLFTHFGRGFANDDILAGATAKIGAARTGVSAEVRGNWTALSTSETLVISTWQRNDGVHFQKCS